MFESERAEIDDMWEICDTSLELFILDETYDIEQLIESHKYSMSYRLDMKSEEITKFLECVMVFMEAGAKKQ